MQIRYQYLQRHLHEMAISQLTDEYQSKGYSVAKDEKIGDVEADLVARKADEVIVVEVKVGSMNSKKREQITKLGDYVNTHPNHKFFVVFATPPKPKKIKVPNLNELLFDYLVDHFPDSLMRLSSHTRIEDVEDATVDELTVVEGGLRVKGGATVGVELHYGSSTDEDSSYDSFPITFDLTLRQREGVDPVLERVHELEIDTSSFYE